MSVWATLDSKAKQFANFIAVIGLVCLVLLALATIADVFMRWIFDSPIHGVHDLYKLVIAVVVGSFFPLTLTERHHIAIRFLGSAVGERFNRHLNTFGNIALLIFLIMMAWQLIKYVADVVDSGETTWILQWSVAPWWAIATVFIILCIPIQFIVTVRDVVDPDLSTSHGHSVPSE